MIRSVVFSQDKKANNNLIDQNNNSYTERSQTLHRTTNILHYYNVLQ